jgi:hypothetical protein
MTIATRLTSTVLVTLLASCAAQAPGGVSAPAHTVFADARCGGQAAGIRRLSDLAQWNELRRRVTRNYLVTPAQGPAVPDFAREAVFVIDMGQRATLGYAIQLASNVATVRDTHIEFRVDWQEPAPDMLQAQMLTSPCIVVSVPAGAYAQATAVDERGRERLRATVR